jgi:hypothetical protein
MDIAPKSNIITFAARVIELCVVALRLQNFPLKLCGFGDEFPELIDQVVTTKAGC